jgi:hypothetical protein
MFNYDWINSCLDVVITIFWKREREYLGVRCYENVFSKSTERRPNNRSHNLSSIKYILPLLIICEKKKNYDKTIDGKYEKKNIIY